MPDIDNLAANMTENLYTRAYQHALAMHESGIRRNEILNYLASSAEAASGSDTTVSILVLDKEGLLRNAASPRLPQDYLQAIDGLKPDAKVGTCCAAAATGNVVITPSFYADNKWAELRHLPLALGYVGAWSMPITTGDKRVIGTFGTYFRKERRPSTQELNGIELLASAVALIFESTDHNEKRVSSR